ncbi:AAA family ATPase [Aeromonas sp. 603404]|uniref:AAA family ATPase n=1 Tax=Aeromonas sp. 603404 TaxID=2712047 RepID=UPI003BA3710E
MLIKFSVSGFKNFKDKITLDFTNHKGYSFNDKYILNGAVNKAIVYGKNGIGKSNLGFAIFDIVKHITDKNIDSDNYKNYINAMSSDELAHFEFEFKFDCGIVNYSYSKKNLENIVCENIKINGNIFAYIDRSKSSIAIINAKGAETLERDIGESMISLVSYIKKNTVLVKDDMNTCFSSFVDFVNGMLFFRSLDKNSYIGYEQGSTGIMEDIIKKGHLEDFQSFLNVAGIDCKLTQLEDDTIGFDFNGKTIPFYSIASQGTKSLALFYYWFQRFRESPNDVSLIFVDEYDAYYHYELAELVVEHLLAANAQVIITTHNTSVISNDLLRPDCYYILGKGSIKSLSNLTSKELREAHNIEKMFKSGAFDEQ